MRVSRGGVSDGFGAANREDTDYDGLIEATPDELGSPYCTEGQRRVVH